MIYLCVYIISGIVVAAAMYRLAGGRDEIGPITVGMVAMMIVFWPFILATGLYGIYRARD